jgi:hypothetical protein
MGIAVSVFLLAAGAILAFAVDLPGRGLDLGVVGVILMLLGGVGLLAAMVLWNDWHPGRRREVDLYDGLDEPEIVLDHRPRARYEDVVVDPPYTNRPVERRVSSRRIIYDR